MPPLSRILALISSARRFSVPRAAGNLLLSAIGMLAALGCVSLCLTPMAGYAAQSESFAPPPDRYTGAGDACFPPGAGGQPQP